MTNVGIQLYTLREFDEPLPSVIERVSNAGFDGVEFAHRLHEEDPTAIRDALDRTNVTPIAAHVELTRLDDAFDEVVSRCRAVGCDRLVLPHIPARRFRTTDRIDQLATELIELSDRLHDCGMQLAYHNTREVFFPPFDHLGIRPLLRLDQVPDGGWNHLADAVRRFKSGGVDLLADTSFGRLLTAVGPGILELEVDIKNVAAAGFEPVEVFDLVADRMTMVHVADIAQVRRVPPRFEAVDPGTGIVDLDRAIEGALDRDVPWVIFEHDAPSSPEGALEQAVEIMAPYFETIERPSTVHRVPAD